VPTYHLGMEVGVFVLLTPALVVAAVT